MNNLEKGVLYVVSTPIGNLQDITLRAIEILKNVEIILAEDTRVTGSLLHSLNIKSNQKFIPCHDFNESQCINRIKNFLDNDKTVALVSDAGTPLISDPGYKIVSALREGEYRIVPIPGASAILAALSVAGLPSNNFLFKGFLSSKKNKRQQELQSFTKLNLTVVIYESVHRLKYLLEDIIRILPTCHMVVAKELTKKFENFINGKACEIKEYFMDNPDKLKGEFVVLLNCNNDNLNDQLSIDDEKILLKELLSEIPLKKAVEITAKLFNLRKNEVYQKALLLKKELDD